jgi:hypothetical protein
MPFTWLTNPWRAPRRPSLQRVAKKLRIEELEKRELLDAASGTRLPIRQAGPAPVFDQSDFISGLYFDLLHRQPQQAEVTAWTSALYAGASKAQVVQGFLSSDEYRADLIRQDYQTFLGRDADPGGLQALLHALQQGETPQDLMAAFVLSNEYYQKQGGTTLAWVQSLYRDILGRPADAAGSALWTQRLQNGLSRTSVASAFVHSPEGNAGLVADAYQNLLGRAPDQAGLQYWAAALGNGLTLMQLDTAFAASAEYIQLQQSADFVNTGGIGSNGGIVNNQVNRFDNRAATTGLTVGPNVNINRETGDQTEETVAVDPNNPQRIFVSANENNLFDGELAAYSTDGGATWTPYVIGTGPFGDGLPLARADPWASWDQFGNLFYTYLSETTPGSSQHFLTLLLSTDGGKSFKTISSFIAANDHPEVTTGAGMVAVTFNAPNSSNPEGQIEVAWANVSGLGQVGSFAVQVIPNSGSKNFGDIAIGPNGQMAVTFQGAVTGAGPDSAPVSTNPNTLGSALFGRPTLATNLNVGSFRAITPQPVRTVTANLGLAYDRSNGPHRGRLYLVYADAVNTTTTNLNIFVRFSDDDGKTWSKPVQVNDDSGRAVHFFPAIAVDQTTGNLGVVWYDTRNDSGTGPGDRDHKPNTDAELFASVSTDGGATFLPNVQVASGPSNAIINNDTFGNDFGDYLGVDYSHGVLFPSWADNSTTLGGNPNLPNFDVAFARVTGPGAATGGGSTGGGSTGGGSTGGGGGGTFVPRPPDRFDPNETSDRAFFFGVLTGTQTTSNLLISRLPNGLVDNNWWRWQAGQSGTFTVQINYQSFDGGDLNLRLFTLDSQNHLIQLGASRAVGTSSQKVSVSVTAGEPLFAWVYGFNHSEAAYQMTVTLG